MADPKLPSPRNQLSSVTMTLMQLCGGWTLMEMKRSHFQTISQLCCHTSSMVTSRKVQLWIKWLVRRWKLGWNPRLTKLKNSISSRLGPPRQVLLVAGNHPMASRTFGRKIARSYRIAIWRRMITRCCATSRRTSTYTRKACSVPALKINSNLSSLRTTHNCTSISLQPTAKTCQIWIVEVVTTLIPHSMESQPQKRPRIRTIDSKSSRTRTLSSLSRP